MHVQVNQDTQGIQNRSAVLHVIVIIVVVFPVNIQDVEEQQALLNVIFADVEAYATIQDAGALGLLALVVVAGVTSHVDDMI
jgi:hypothetical protein